MGQKAGPVTEPAEQLVEEIRRHPSAVLRADPTWGLRRTGPQAGGEPVLTEVDPEQCRLRRDRVLTPREGEATASVPESVNPRLWREVFGRLAGEANEIRTRGPSRGLGAFPKG
jgi:hypothetical protein